MPLNEPLQDVVHWIASSLGIQPVGLFLKTDEIYELAYVSANPGIASCKIPAVGALERALTSQPEPSAVEWKPDGAYLAGEHLDATASEALAVIHSRYLVALAAANGLRGFLSIGKKLCDEPLAVGDIRLLQSIAGRLSFALASEPDKRSVADWEVEIARDVQNRIFPSTQPFFPGLDYYSDWRPARGVSGDYLDYFELDAGNLGLAVGDVSGKGLSASLLTSSLHGMIRALRLSQSCELPELVGTIDEMFRDICPSNCYATLFVARYDPFLGQLRYVNAGHEPPFVLRKKFDEYHAIPLESGGPVIGMLRRPHYSEGVVSLGPGDLLVAYTDGLTEAKSVQGEEWGLDRLVGAIRQCGGRPACSIVAHVMSAVEEFSVGAPQYDDMTLWLARVDRTERSHDFTLVEHLTVGAAA